MDQLFAPWRIDWVERDGETIDGCPFCVLPESEDDRDALIVAKSEHAFVLLNKHPYNPGHVMVIPDRHTDSYTDLDDAELLDHARLKQRTMRAMDHAFSPDGLNVGLNLGDAAGGSIDDHFHTHVVPRWRGDTNFMAVSAETKVVVQALEEGYDHLRDGFLDQTDAVAIEGAAVHFDFDDN